MQYYNINYITIGAKSSLICKALLKYGYSAFKLEILEYCDPDLIIEREQYYIDHLNPQFNILRVAGSLFGYKHTPKSLEKMKEIALNRSDETKAKLRKAALGKKHNEETKSKLRIIQSNRVIHPVAGFKLEVKDVQTGEVFYYDSLRAAGKELDCHHSSLSSYLNKDGKGKPFKGRYIIIKKSSE